MKMDSTMRLFCISVVVLVFCVCSLPRSAAETEACRKVYREGGAMAVIRSPECPRWGHSLSWGRLTDSTTVHCSEAILDALGRDFTHNHFFCDVDIRFPLRRLHKEATLGIVAIFDGYYSNEASETAWKYIEEYFFLHTYFLFDRLEGDNFDGSYVKMLKEALVRAIHDIKNRYTATIIVMVDDHLFLSSLDGSAEVATGSYSRWMAASQSQSQSMCEVSSRRLDGDGWGYSLKNLI
ncbi:probable protein phosphatase 2C 51 [Camellia sinensis]|uniref:probable protein phosphatase 2C 51 n=1 Tax=Camellia sinensis TaxID=4442 RepID=UPI001035A967|nr:probable protein phosphatase 2C 51 [Camellia sinensis]